MENFLKNKKQIIFIGIFTSLIIFRILLITGIPKMYQSLPSDDLFYVKAAHNIIHGDWMGTYNQTTLIKGPFYAFFLVFSFLTGLPLFLNETFFYIAACILLFYAIQPLIRSHWWRLLLFSFLLFCPQSLATFWNLRVYREFVYLSLTLFVITFSIGLFLRIDRKLSSLIFWGSGLGLSTGAFMLTREEGVWVYPVLFFILLAAVWQVRINKVSQKWIRTTIILLPILISYLPTLIVSSVNYSHYGFWGYSENLDKDYLSIRNTLCSIETSSWKPPYRPISQKALSEAYKASAHLSELKTFIDANFDLYRTFSDRSISWKPDWFKDKYFIEGQGIGNGHFIWLLRDALASKGYYSGGKFPRENIKAIADELEAACDNGTLKCRHDQGIPLVGSINMSNIPIIIHFFIDDFYRLFKFDGNGSVIFNLDLSNWTQDHRDFDYFEESSYNPISYQFFGNPDSTDRLVGDHTDIRLIIILIKENLMQGIYSIYKFITLPLGVILSAAWGGILLTKNHNVKKLENHQAFIIFLFISGLLFTRAMTLAVIDTTTAIRGFGYSTSNYIFLYIILFLMFYYWCANTIKTFSRNRI